jgi:hypothetical protein
MWAAEFLHANFPLQVSWATYSAVPVMSSARVEYCGWYLYSKGCSTCRVTLGLLCLTTHQNQNHILPSKAGSTPISGLPNVGDERATISNE